MPDGRHSPADGFPEFRARFPWHGPHLQTLRNFLRRPEHPLPLGERRHFDMDDGTGDVLLGALHRPERASGRPLAVLLHGLTGCEDAPYVRSTAAALLAEGHPVLRLNLRGAGPSAPLCAEHYHAGRTGDIRRVLSLLGDADTRDGVVLGGYSLGGNAALKFLGENDFPVPVLAGFSVSAPIDLSGCAQRFLRPANRVYHDRMLRQMKALALACRPPLDPRWRDAILKSRTTWDFDHLLVGPRHGWSGAEEYYAVNSALGFLPRIRVPTLVLHALDDPWIPPDAYLSFDWASNPHLTPLLSPGGGHVGFHGEGGVWSDRCLAVFLRRLPQRRSSESAGT
ncbi:MAG TPA: alpha/beta fold hydrolase [Azospirillaceae bacterium]|nr:alpha/beta fold hydrolase [Azospirillaceae bacterium]